MWQLSEGTSWVFCSSVYDLSLLLWSGICSRIAQAHKRRMFPLAVLAWETFQKATLLHPGGTRENGEIKPIRSTPGASPPHLSGGTEGDDSETPPSVTDRLGEEA